MSCVYKIYCLDKKITEYYIGSTNNIIKRSITHKFNCSNLNTKIYKFIRDNGGWDNWEMIEYIKTDNLDKKERFELEQLCIKQLKPELNEYNSVGLDSIKKQNNQIKHNIIKKIKVECPFCNKKMRKDSLKRHIAKCCQG